MNTSRDGVEIRENPDSQIEGDQATGSVETPSHDETLAEISRLLRGDSSEGEQSEDEGSTEGEAPGKKVVPKTLAELSEATGIDVAELYNLSVPSSKEGESFTLGELKDAMAKQSSFQVRELEWEEQRAKAEAETIRARAEMEELLTSLPKSILKPELIEKVKAAYDGRVQAERRKTLEVIPDWKDADRRTSEIEGMVDHLKGYGLSAEYLGTVTDHRMIRYIRENWLRQQRIERVLQSVKEKQPKGQPKSKPASGRRSPPRMSNPARTLDAQVSAVANLLKNGVD
jgi:hypothetical protein